MISGKENILKWVEQNDAPFWKIFPHGASRNNYLAGYENNNSMSESLSKLSSTLDMLGTGRYVLCAKEKPEQAKGFFETVVEHQNGAVQTATVSGVGTTPSLSNEFFEHRLHAEISKLKTEFKMEALEKENNELKLKVKELEHTGLEGTINNIIKRCDPYIDPVMDHFFPIEKTTKIAAVGFTENHTKQTTTMPKTIPTTDEEATARAQKALQIWAEKDPDNFLLVVEKIAETIQNSPTTYNMYAQMLLK